MKVPVLRIIVAAFAFCTVHSGTANAFSVGNATRSLGSSVALKQERARLTESVFEIKQVRLNTFGPTATLIENSKAIGTACTRILN